jgi:two-component system, chemotaxis family, protein-glutamate methylesterase/glutaminase
MARPMLRPQPYRVLVVDDSHFMRTALRHMINSEPGFSVVGEAADGKKALAAIAALRPDIVTLDIEMPEMTGIEVLKHLRPQPGQAPIFIMVSAFTTAGAGQTLASLQAGALDFVPKASESFKVDLGQVGRILIEKLVVAAARLDQGMRADPAAAPLVPVGSAGSPPSLASSSRDQALERAAASAASAHRPNPVTSAPPAGPAAAPAAEFPAGGRLSVAPDLLVIAASTGGPQTLPLVLAALTGFPAPIVVAQHIPPLFSRSLAESLSASTGLNCIEADADVELMPGTVYIIRGGHDGEIGRTAGGRLKLILKQPGDANFHPNADMLFRSAALQAKRPLATILTGMGSDGCEGARALVQRGRPVLVQDPASAVLWGMPQSAIDAGLATEVLEPKALGRRLAMLGRRD